MTMVKARRTVLIVGENSQNREIYRQCLQEDTNHTYTIWEEQSIERGLKLCHDLQPDVVLLSLCSVAGGAWEFLAEIESQQIISGVIVLTQQQDELIAAQLLENGVQNCLVKEETSPQSLRCAVRSAIEITNLRRSLQQSTERLNLALEVAQIASWEWNILTDEVWLSENFASLFGMESGTFANTSNAWLERVYPEDRESVMNAITQVREKNGDYFQEYRLLLNGKISWVCSQGKLSCDKVGHPLRMVGTIQDITASKQSEEQLQESQDLIQQIANTTPGILYVYDLSKQRNIYINNQVTQVLGYSQKCVERMGAEFTKQLMHPEDYLRLAAHIEQFNCAREGEVFSFEYRMRHANREWRWFTSRDKVFKCSQDGRPLQIIGSAQDITERKNTEEALQRSHEQFQLATMAVKCFVYDWDIPRNYVERTQGLFEVLGYTESEVIPTAKWLETIIHSSDRQRVEEEFQAALVSGDRYSIEYRLRYKQEPRYLWVRDTGFAVRNRDGCITRIAGIMIDINESKQSQAKLQETVEQVNLATAAAQLGMWFWNITTDELIWTEKCKALFGLSADTEISYEIFLNSLHPEDQQYTHEAVTRTLEENIEYNIEYRTVWSDGSIHWIAAKGRSFYNSEGKAVRMMGTAQDISKRKQIEESFAINQERLELAQKTGQIGVYDWDIQTGAIAWNEEEEIIFGLPLGSFGGRVENWREQVYPDDLPQVEQSFQQTIENQIQNWQGEFRIFHQGTGEIHWIEARGRFFYDELGQPLRMIGTNIDITERKQSQEALRQSEMHFRRLVESNIIGCVVADMVGNITEANDAFLSMVDYTREELGSGRLRWIDITPPEYAYLDRLAIAQAREFGACTPFEKEYIRKDGSRVPILIGFALLEDDNDNVICFIVDQTERKITEEALRQSQAHLNSFVEANVIGIVRTVT
jgi:PAS domain S-box-containing protein